jgi:hypothetical protein
VTSQKYDVINPVRKQLLINWSFFGVIRDRTNHCNKSNSTMTDEWISAWRHYPSNNGGKCWKELQRASRDCILYKRPQANSKIRRPRLKSVICKELREYSMYPKVCEATVKPLSRRDMRATLYPVIVTMANLMYSLRPSNCTRKLKYLRTKPLHISTQQ